MSLQSPLGRARGLGSAKEGVAHWWWQRLTAIALAPLSIWFVWLVLSLLHADFETIHSTLSRPLVAILLMSFMVSLYYHGALGLQTIVEDYVHARGMEITMLVVVKFSAFLFAITSLLAIARIALAG